MDIYEDLSLGSSNIVYVSDPEWYNCEWPVHFDELSDEGDIVYVLTNGITGRRYIGSTMYSVEHRIRAILSCARNGYDTALCRAIRRFGIQTFRVEFVPFLGVLLAPMEAYFIDAFDTVKNGYNNTTCTTNSDHWRFGYSWCSRTI